MHERSGSWCGSHLDHDIFGEYFWSKHWQHLQTKVGMSLNSTALGNANAVLEDLKPTVWQRCTCKPIDRQYLRATIETCKNCRCSQQASSTTSIHACVMLQRSCSQFPAVMCSMSQSGQLQGISNMHSWLSALLLFVTGCCFCTDMHAIQC